MRTTTASHASERTEVAVPPIKHSADASRSTTGGEMCGETREERREGGEGGLVGLERDLSGIGPKRETTVETT